MNENNNKKEWVIDMRYIEVVTIYMNTLNKVHHIEYNAPYTLVNQPSKSLSYRYSKNIWVLKNINGTLAVVNTLKKTVRLNFFKPPFNNYKIVCKIKKMN